VTERERIEAGNRWIWRVWLTVAIVVYVAAKLHTWTTFGSPEWFEHHWLFWTAMIGWACLGWLVNRCVKLLRGGGPGPLD
jgi:hypothetical protein